MASRQFPFRRFLPGAGRQERVRRRARGIPTCLAVFCAVSLVAAVPANARTLFMTDSRPVTSRRGLW